MHIVDEVSDFGATWFGIGCGEPLLRKDIFEIISHAKDLGLKVSLITNGYFVEGEKFDNLVKNEVRTSISLDGSEPINDMLRGKGAYRRALSAIKKLSDSGILDCLVLTLTNINYKDVDHLLDLAEEYGARWVVIHGVIPVGKAKKNIHLSPTPEQYEWTWNHLYDLTTEYKGQSGYQRVLPVVRPRG